MIYFIHMDVPYVQKTFIRGQARIALSNKHKEEE